MWTSQLKNDTQQGSKCWVVPVRCIAALEGSQLWWVCALSDTRKGHPCRFLVAYAFSYWTDPAQAGHLLSVCSRSDLWFGYTPASCERESSLTDAALRACSRCTKPAKISQQPLPSSSLFSEEKLGVKQLGNLTEKETEGHECVCAEPLVDDWSHKIVWLVRLSNSHSHRTTSLESLEKCLGFPPPGVLWVSRGKMSGILEEIFRKKGRFWERDRRRQNKGFEKGQERGWISKNKYKDNNNGMDGTRKGMRERTEKQMGRNYVINGKVTKEETVKMR